MPDLKRLPRKRRRVPTGDLDTLIYVEDRIQEAPDFAMVDAGFSFKPSRYCARVWARVETTAGKTHFDGVQQDRRITHRVHFRKISGVDAETWLRLPSGLRLDIVDIQNLDSRGEFQEALCEATGFDTKAAAGNPA